MPKLNSIPLFLLIIIPILGIAFFLHTAILQANGLPEYGDKILLSYVINFLLAAIIYMGLSIFRNKIKTQIGFVFMGGSFLKFLVFFILFYPSYKTDGEMSTSEFAAFFAPYAICLVVETIFMAKMLQKMERSNPT